MSLDCADIAMESTRGSASEGIHSDSHGSCCSCEPERSQRSFDNTRHLEIELGGFMAAAASKVLMGCDKIVARTSFLPLCEHSLD